LVDEGFEKAKASAILSLQKLIAVSQNLDNIYPGSGFYAHAVSLQGLENKIKGCVGLCLNDEDIQKIDNLRQFLTMNNKFKDKLGPLSHLCVEISKAAFLDETLTLDVTEAQKNASVFATINEITEEARVSVANTPMNILTIMTVMLLLISRRHTFYHLNKKMLKDGIETLKLKDLDIEELCSIHSKIGRRTKNGINYESDVEAIRNCIAHPYYEIKRKNEGGYVIRFEKHEDGYDFVKEFADIQLIEFFNDYLLLERLQTLMMHVSLVEGMLLRYLYKDTQKF
jgi:hypothetical protein